VHHAKNWISGKSVGKIILVAYCRVK